MERGWLTRAGQAAMERLDLPGDIPAGVPHMELIGEREFFMCRHRGVLSYSTETVEIGGGSLTVRVIGTELQLVLLVLTLLTIFVGSMLAFKEQLLKKSSQVT